MDYFNSCLPSPRPFLFAFGAYTVVAIVFYYYPEIIPRRKRNDLSKYNFLVISHRGGSGESNENTLSAFKHSSDVGVDVFELDCHMTKDGKVVVAHDNNLSRLCGVERLISETNYDDLPLLLTEHTEDIFLDINKELEHLTPSKEATSSDGTTTSGLHNRVNGEHAIDPNDSKRIPLLEEIFERFPHMPINIDIKFDNDELIKKVNELIIKHNREKITIWGSFKDSVKKKCYRVNNRIPIYFSLVGVVKLLLLMLTGLLPFVPLSESHLEIIMPNNLLKYKRNSLPRAAIAPFLLIKMFLVRKSLVRHLQKRGIFVIYWTLNSEEEFETALEVGANGIITDYPSKLIQFLNKKPELQKILKRPTKDNF